MTDTVPEGMPMMALEDDYEEIREQVAKLCEEFPGQYWRNLEKQPPSGSYPTEFIDALTSAGYLAALIPEEYGGAGLPVRGGAVILETINRMGCSAAAGHAQMYTMGTVLRHGSKEQKEHFLPKIATGELRLQAFGVTEPTTGSDTTQIKTRAEKQGNGYVVNGQKVWTSRAAHSDLMLLLARTTPADKVAKRTDGISTFLIDLREAQKMGCTITPIDAVEWLDIEDIALIDAGLFVDDIIGNLMPVEPAKIRKVVLATNATLEGQTTSHYLAERLERFPIRLTQLAHGLPVGGELDYLDEGTLAQALRARRPLS